MEIFPQLLPSQSESPPQTAEEKISDTLNSAHTYLKLAQTLEKLAGEEIDLAVELCARLAPDEVLLLSFNQDINVRARHRKNYKTQQFAAKGLRNTPSGVEAIAANEDRITLNGLVYSLEVAKASAASDSTAV